MVLHRVTMACQEQCKSQKLREFEIPQRFALIADPWTPENDMLTAAMKLKRPLIAEKHRAEIAELYQTSPALASGASKTDPNAKDTAGSSQKNMQ